MSAQLLLINPRRRRKKKSHRRRAKNARRHRRTASGHRIRRRRVRNPRARRHHRKHYARKRNPRMRRRRHRNPLSISGVKSALMPAAIGAAGGVALDVAYGYLGSYLPASLQTGMAASAVKLAAAFGLGMVATKVLGAEKGRAVTIGAVTVQLYGLLKSTLASAAPSVPGLAGFGAYIASPGMSGLGYGANPAVYLQKPAGMGRMGRLGRGRMGAYIKASPMPMAGLDGGSTGMGMF